MCEIRVDYTAKWDPEKKEKKSEFNISGILTTTRMDEISYRRICKFRKIDIRYSQSKFDHIRTKITG